MAGSLTLGGLADGLVAGQVTIGPSTITGKLSITEVVNLELEAGKDTTVKVPPEAVAWALMFSFSGTEGAEIKIRTNLNSTDGGIPIPAQGFVSMPLFSGTTSLIFHPVSAPKLCQLVFV